MPSGLIPIATNRGSTSICFLSIVCPTPFRERFSLLYRSASIGSTSICFLSIVCPTHFKRNPAIFDPRGHQFQGHLSYKIELPPAMGCQPAPCEIQALLGIPKQRFLPGRALVSLGSASESVINAVSMPPSLKLPQSWMCTFCGRQVKSATYHVRESRLVGIFSGLPSIAHHHSISKARISAREGSISLSRMPSTPFTMPHHDGKLGPTVGAFEIGVVVALLLFGINTHQVFVYFRKYPKDPLAMKFFVGTVCLFEALHTCFIAYALYWITVENFGKPKTAIKNPLKVLCAPNIIASFTVSIIQGFFAYRVHLISRNWITLLICGFLSLLHLAGEIALAIWGYRASSIFEWKAQCQPILVIVFLVSTVTDVLIALNLCRGLWMRRSDGVRSGPHRLLDKLISWSLETCLLTSIGMILMIILFTTMQNFAWLAVFLFISRLFSISLLASLNGRRSLRESIGQVPTFVEIGACSRNLTVARPRTLESTSLSIQMNFSSRTLRFESAPAQERCSKRRSQSSSPIGARHTSSRRSADL